MKTFQTGVSYLRSTARAKGLIGDADTDDLLIQRLAALATNASAAAITKARGEEEKASEPAPSSKAK